MSLNTIATMASDGDLKVRFIACAAQEGVPAPESWVNTNMWALCSDTGMANAYDSALANRMRNPGQWNDVVSDGMILSVVQALWNEQKPA